MISSQKDRNVARDPATNIFEVDYGDMRYAVGTGKTTTLGLVGHVTKNISLLYNQSKNIDIPIRTFASCPPAQSAIRPRAKARITASRSTCSTGRLTRAQSFTTDLKGEIGFGGAPMGIETTRC